MAMTHFCDGAGGYAELAVVDAGLAAPIGRAVSFTAAAATPLAAGTAQDVLARLALPTGSEGARGDSPMSGICGGGRVFIADGWSFLPWPRRRLWPRRRRPGHAWAGGDLR